MSDQCLMCLSVVTWDASYSYTNQDPTRGERNGGNPATAVFLVRAPSWSGLAAIPVAFVF